MRHPLIATTLLLAAFNCAALTLGRSRGAVLVGQPLDVRIQAALEPGDDPASLCFDAEVFHADSRIDPARVTTRVEGNAAAREIAIRVRSSAVVDEPVVTVYLRAGCTQKFTRRYVFLADVALDAASVPVAPETVTVVPGLAFSAAAATPRSLAPAAPAATAASAPAAPSAAAREKAAAARAARKAAREERAAARAAAAANTSGESAPAKAQPAARALSTAVAKPASVVRRTTDARTGRARLQLDPLDLVAERDPTLRASTELLSVPADNEQKRAEARAMWQAINAQPQDVLRDMQRLQALEADTRTLKAAAAKANANLAETKTRLEQAEAERYANPLVYALAGLLAAALVLAGYFWRNSRNAWSGRDWWTGRDPGPDADDASQRPDSLLPPQSTIRATVRAPHTVQPSQVDVDLGVNEDMFASLKGAPAVTRAEPTSKLFAQSEFAGSMIDSPRAVNAEELFDIQQQADFFISLGQYDQAIEVLKNHISDNVETSALAYLDLLKIYRKLDRKDDYTQLRADFNRVFNAQIPIWDEYTEESSGLEAYSKALSRIESLWPSPKVLEIIEESIFRKPGMGEGEAFDLEAYRELLLLYAIAKEIVQERAEAQENLSGGMDFEFSSGLGDDSDGAGDGPPRSRFSATNIQPLSASLPSIPGDSLPPVMDMDMEIPLPRPSPRLGLDIDLSEVPNSAFLEPEVSDGSSSISSIRDSIGFSLEEPTLATPAKPAPASFDIGDIELAGKESSDRESGPGHSEAGFSLDDIDLFDPATEQDIAPRKPPKR